jgi:hypothetical protein
MSLRALGSVVLASSLGLLACGGDDADASNPSSTSSTASTSGAGGSTSSGSNGSTGPGSSGSTGPGGGGGGGDIPGGGTILFEEPFDDAAFESRGWYDGSAGDIDTIEHIPGSASSWRCDFAAGASSCTNGKPARHLFTDSETVYLSFHLKFGAGWVGSGQPYHPHMFHFVNNLDDDYIGPSHSFLTTYIEVVGNRPLIALQDSKNVDLGCILRNDDTFVGCNGDFATYPFTEARSACACNGLAGDLDGRDCFPNGDGTWYSSRSWRPAADYFTDGAWHFVEVYFAMNSVADGIAIPDGKIRWVYDGQTIISHDAILLRTGAHATLAFNQFDVLPYIGDGSPIEQSFWVDDLTVATARP